MSRLWLVVFAANRDAGSSSAQTAGTTTFAVCEYAGSERQRITVPLCIWHAQLSLFRQLLDKSTGHDGSLLVADALETDWNDKLRALTAAQDDYERRRSQDTAVLGPEQRERIAALATDFPAIWSATGTSYRDRKRMLRLLIEDVTLVKGQEAIAVHVRFRGGGTRSVSLPRPVPAWKSWLTPTETVAQVDSLLAQHTEAEIATILNERGFRSGQGHRFHSKIVSNIRVRYRLKSRYDRLRERGMVTAEELSQSNGISRETVLRWRKQGLVQAHAYNDHHQYLYDPAAAVPAATARWSRIRAEHLIASTSEKEVQCEA